MGNDFEQDQIEFNFPKRKNLNTNDFKVSKSYPDFALGFRSWRIYSEDEINKSKTNSYYGTSSIFGYDYQFVPDSHEYLYSIIRERRWEKGANIAVCDNVNSDHAAPFRDCHCGFNAFFDVEKAIKHSVDTFYPETKHIIGAVLGWGAAEVHRDGWRAEKSVVIGLLESGVPNECLDALLAKYEIPSFKNSRALEEYGLRFGLKLDF